MMEEKIELLQIKTTITANQMAIAQNEIETLQEQVLTLLEVVDDLVIRLNR